MNALLRPLLRRLLLRDPEEIARRARAFRIATQEGRDLVARLGGAFVGGFNAMLTERTMRDVAALGMRVPSHFRPFFFEGAAMGYLPRGYLWRGFTAASAERELLSIDPSFRYLYYVGLGFWFAIRHPRRPASLRSLESEVDPLYFPLCYDGYGFKVAFFDYPRRPASVQLLERCPPEHRPAIYQGFGRALFFVHMDDEDGLARLSGSLPPERRADLEMGRSLALAFTGVDRPVLLARHIASARDEEDLSARLTGVTWALTARAMNDPPYFESCVRSAPRATADLLRRLPPLCLDALAASSTYIEWQRRTREYVLRAYEESREGLAAEAHIQ